ncbi:MAG: hypothetical protein QXQ95_08140 [Thermofilum sp.]|uniref:Uncharacterized protein n=1 Tax=Thermofilum adornatum TaxID=1365176 RepID=S5ZFQ0_9CREN|nr:hypothetical protein [Thermofilum adornatum]AGT35983.1 hypothetical protein N186_08225 [Thermofilum adornatum]
MLKKGNPLIIAALSEGIELYITPEFELLKNTYMDLVKRASREPKSLSSFQVKSNNKRKQPSQQA